MSSQTRIRSALKTSQERLQSTLYQVLLVLAVVLLIFVVLVFTGLSQNSLFVTLFAIIGLAVAGFGAWQLGQYILMYRRTGQREIMASLQRDLSRADTVYRFASGVGNTLDYSRTLNEALEIGQLALHSRSATNLIAAALLFRQSDNRLHVATARLLNRHDYSVTCAAREGILAQALESTEPLYGGSGKNDPELCRMGAFQNARSLLIIPLKVGYESYGVLAFGSVHPDAFDPKAANPLKVIASQISIALKNAVLYQTLLDDKERIVSIDEQARKKLARDLHDGPTQTIAIIASVSSVIQRYLKNGDVEKATKELDKVQGLAQKTTKEIRHLLFSLRPLVLENRGLIAALEDLAHKMKETYDQNVAVDADAQVERLLDDEAQGTVFYIIEEAINNAAKHAEAQLIRARLVVQQPYILIEIEDNGRGFDVGLVNTDYHKRGSLGMVNLRERAEMLRGELSIDSQPGHGTKITVYVPIPEQADAKRQYEEPHVEAGDTYMAQGIEPADNAPKSPDDEAGWESLNL